MTCSGSFRGDVIPLNRHPYMLSRAAHGFPMRDIARKSSLGFFESLIDASSGDDLLMLLLLMQDRARSLRHPTFGSDASLLEQDDRDMLALRIADRQQRLHEE
ncbi:MAG TPA: hypothetical protein VFL98_00575 [Candidatus Paceibacterota bacterium]|nr:hypothetical protein [Candidatus Paceibacterota bacterium]